MKSLKDLDLDTNAYGHVKMQKPQHTLGSTPLTSKNDVSDLKILEARYDIEEAFALLRHSLYVTGCIDEPSHRTVRKWENEMMARWHRIARGKI